MPLARWLKLDAPLASSVRSPLIFEQTHNLDGVTRNFTIAPGSAQDGCELAKLGLPKGALVLLVRRAGKYIVPEGKTVILADDELMVIGKEAVLTEAENILTRPDESTPAASAQNIVPKNNTAVCPPENGL